MRRLDILRQRPKPHRVHHNPIMGNGHSLRPLVLFRTNCTMAADSRCLLDSLISETVEVPTAATNRTHIVALQYRGQRAGPGCLNRFSASISGASTKVRLPSGGAAA